jgi:two-component system OmpR family response regulator
MKIKALIIDDDRKLSGLLTEYLRRFDIIVAQAASGDEGLRMLRSDPPDVVLLDVMLPGRDGFEICREIRKTSDVPVLMLTARGEVADRIVGLEIGADDYLPKPFEPRELAARIQAVRRNPALRRFGSGSGEAFRDPQRRRPPPHRPGVRCPRHFRPVPRHGAAP